jgi:hypothetical protein
LSSIGSAVVFVATVQAGRIIPAKVVPRKRVETTKGKNENKNNDNNNGP